jgi:hypothetical protein
VDRQDVKVLAIFFITTISSMAKRQLSIVERLEDVQDILNEKYQIYDLDPIFKDFHEAFRTILELTRFGDCLFGDEIRHIMLIPHSIRPRRGTDQDPLKGKRKFRRKKIKA